MLEEYGTATRYRATPPPPPPPPRPRPFDGGIEQAVRKVQRENHLPETGRLDGDTLQALRARSPSLPSGTLGQRVESHGLVGPGDEGPEVDELQTLLDGYGREASAPAPAFPPCAPTVASEPRQKSVWDKVLDTAGEAWNGAQDKAEDVWNDTKAKGEEVWNDAKGVWNQGKEAWHAAEDAAKAATHIEATAVNSLNSEGDKASVKVKLGGSLGIDGDGIKKLAQAGKLIDPAKLPDGAKAAGAPVAKAQDAAIDIIESLNLTAKASAEFSADVSLVKNATSGALEYQVTTRKSCETGDSLGLPILPKGLGGNIDVSGGTGKAVGLETTYKFQTKEDAILGLQHLRNQEMHPGTRNAWLQGHQDSTQFEFAGKLSAGITFSKDLPGSAIGGVDFGGAVETGNKLEGTLKLVVKKAEQPGMPDQVIVEFKNVAKSDLASKVSADAGVKFEGSSSSGIWENEHTVQLKYEIAPGQKYLDVLQGAPKSVDFKGVSTRWDIGPAGDRLLGVDRRDSEKVEYAKSVPIDQVDWKRELGIMGLVLAGRTGDPQNFEAAGYRATRKEIDASGITANGKIGIPFTPRGIPIKVGLEAGFEIGVDDTTTVG